MWGVLYKRAGLNISPLIYGGEQERGFRAGTENIAVLVSPGYAIEESIDTMFGEVERLCGMSEDTVNGIKKRIPFVRINGDDQHRLPGIVNLGLDGILGESLMHLLDLKGVCVSTSSACTSGKDEPSHVLQALGQNEQQTWSAIRISYGGYNTIGEVEIIVKTICDFCEKIMAN